MSDNYEKLKAVVEAASDDVAKADSGNRAAGTRVRKSMQEIKALCGDIRKDMIEARAAE